MKKFFITIILFLLGLYVFACIPDLILTNKIKKSPYLDFQVWNKMFSGQMDYDLLILGSSRAFVQYNPKIIDSILKCNCYNLGRDGKKQDISILLIHNIIQSQKLFCAMSILCQFVRVTPTQENSFIHTF